MRDSANFSTFGASVCFAYIRGPFEKIVDWWQCATAMQRETVTVMPSCNSGGNIVMA